MDFWPQHKEFILKVLAGLGVFLVALIARNVTYGDDWEAAEATNARLASKVRNLKIAPIREIAAAENAAEELARNTVTMIDQFGWNTAREGVQQELLRRILSTLRSVRQLDEASFDLEVERARDAIRDDLNGGFGQLRLRVRDELVEEGSEFGVEIAPGIGFEGVLGLEAGELTKYLLQLELTARTLRLCIDERVDAVPEIRLGAPREGEVLPGKNPEFLREYFVDVVFRGPQEAAVGILNALDRGKRVPWRELRIDRVARPPDHVEVQVQLVAVAANPEVPFEVEGQ